jgi:flagellar biosynthesis component FlhA
MMDWKQRIHQILKPLYRAMIQSIYSNFSDMVKDKDEKGWNSEFVQRIRKVFERIEKSEFDYGLLSSQAFRPHLRMIFDMLCLEAEAEPIYTKEFWRMLVQELKREGLI